MASPAFSHIPLYPDVEPVLDHEVYARLPGAGEPRCPRWRLSEILASVELTRRRHPEVRA